MTDIDVYSTAREMAVRMLYQVDLGGSELPQVFHAFDLSEFWSKPQRAKAGATEEESRRRQGAEEAFNHACELVRGTVVKFGIETVAMPPVISIVIALSNNCRAALRGARFLSMRMA